MKRWRGFELIGWMLVLLAVLVRSWSDLAREDTRPSVQRPRKSGKRTAMHDPL